MTPKEKAVELLNKYLDITNRWVSSPEDIKFRVKCALIAVDEIIEQLLSDWGDNQWRANEYIGYWQEVKTEIESL